MEKKILSLILSLMLLTTMFVLTGCGTDDGETNDNSEVIEILNNAVASTLESWDSKGYATNNWSPNYIQKRLDDNDYSCTIIACGDIAFTSIPTNYYIGYIGSSGNEAYEGNIAEQLSYIRSDAEWRYLLVYNNNKYYNVEMNFETCNLSKGNKQVEYPVFSNAKALN